MDKKRIVEWPQKINPTKFILPEYKTRVTLTWEIQGAATLEELDTFIKSRAGMNQGWGGSFDKLEEYLAT